MSDFIIIRTILDVPYCKKYNSHLIPTYMQKIALETAF